MSLIKNNIWFINARDVLIKSKHSTLENGGGQYLKVNQSLYKHLFPESFDAHDALGELS